MHSYPLMLYYQTQYICRSAYIYVFLLSSQSYLACLPSRGGRVHAYYSMTHQTFNVWSQLRFSLYKHYWPRLYRHLRCWSFWCLNHPRCHPIVCPTSLSILPILPIPLIPPKNFSFHTCSTISLLIPTIIPLASLQSSYLLSSLPICLHTPFLQFIVQFLPLCCSVSSVSTSTTRSSAAIVPQADLQMTRNHHSKLMVYCFCHYLAYKDVKEPTGQGTSLSDSLNMGWLSPLILLFRIPSSYELNTSFTMYTWGSLWQVKCCLTDCNLKVTLLVSLITQRKYLIYPPSIPNYFHDSILL